ncbi:hypothetical protein BpHYR1_046409 [Brachionus plicatilis]|uniref:Uncharacterized protein n=1 Tax=Brachionus plicatilis TaxID=10195 RepID=A0A3M7RHS4_BRAPC|nr:hypothetical protein BpHYR1_046409 [Brachionus plicatilis]
MFLLSITVILSSCSHGFRSTLISNPHLSKKSFVFASKFAAVRRVLDNKYIELLCLHLQNYSIYMYMYFVLNIGKKRQIMSSERLCDQIMFFTRLGQKSSSQSQSSHLT